MDHHLLPHPPANAKPLWGLVDSGTSGVAMAFDVVAIIDIGFGTAATAFTVGEGALATGVVTAGGSALIFPVVTWVASAFGPFFAIAAPLADAQANIKRRQTLYGFWVGMVTAAAGHNLTFAKSMVLHTNNNGGVMHPGVRGIANRAFNLGFVKGYTTGMAAKPQSLKNVFNAAVALMIERGEAGAIDNLSERDLLRRLGALMASAGK